MHHKGFHPLNPPTGAHGQLLVDIKIWVKSGCCLKFGTNQRVLTEQVTRARSLFSSPENILKHISKIDTCSVILWYRQWSLA